MSLFSRKKNTDVPRRRQNASGAATKRQAADVTSNETFRRNRTLTGSVSANVASANELQSDLKSPRSLAHELSKLRRKLGSVLLGILLLIGISGFGLYQLPPPPSVLPAAGSLQIDPSRYKKVIAQYLPLHPIERPVSRQYR